jgi:hypothetical protein
MTTPSSGDEAQAERRNITSKATNTDKTAAFFTEAKVAIAVSDASPG